MLYNNLTVLSFRRVLSCSHVHHIVIQLAMFIQSFWLCFLSLIFHFFFNNAFITPRLVLRYWKWKIKESNPRPLSLQACILTTARPVIFDFRIIQVIFNSYRDLRWLRRGMEMNFKLPILFGSLRLWVILHWQKVFFKCIYFNALIVKTTHK